MIGPEDAPLFNTAETVDRLVFLDALFGWLIIKSTYKGLLYTKTI